MPPTFGQQLDKRGTLPRGYFRKCSFQRVLSSMFWKCSFQRGYREILWKCGFQRTYGAGRLLTLSMITRKYKVVKA